jgi:nucleoside-diphosphate-sugar epimerase
MLEDFPQGRCLVIGAAGFIGGNVSRHLQSKGIPVREAFRQTPLEQLADEVFDAVFFCAGNSRTYLSERDPLACLVENVHAVYAYLTALRYRTWIQVSSVSVYPPNCPEKAEEIPLSAHEVSIYGMHKLLGERYVTRFAPRWVIVRPTSFFGPGLKKNLLFDLQAGKRDIYLTTDSLLDYIPVRTFADILLTLGQHAENEIVNVGSGCSLTVKEILAMKPANYIYHDERYHSDAGISFARLRRYYPQTLSQTELRDSVREFIHSPAESF